MHVNQLEYFAATIEAGSFAGAAKKASVTPQAIEKSMHGLERELGGKLFEAFGRGSRPTRLARRLYETALDAIASVDRMHDITRVHSSQMLDGETITLAVAIAPHRCAWFTRASFDPFRREFPGVNLDVKFNSSGICLAAIRTGMADAGIIIGPVEDGDLRVRRLFSSPVQIALAESHPLASDAYGKLSLRAIARHPVAMPFDADICYPRISRSFEEAGASPQFVEVDFGGESEFLSSGGIVLVASRAHIEGVAPCVKVKEVMDRECITLPICFVEKPDASTALSQRVALYAALAGEKMKRLQQ